MAFGRLGARRRIADAAHGLYVAAVTQARRPEFYGQLAVADSVDGRFDLVALHVFLVLNRLGRDGAALRELGQALFDLMFADMDQNLREMGVSDISVGTKVKTMVKAFYGRVAAYEAGLDDRGAMEDAVARNLYRGEPVDKACLAAVATYICGEAESLATQDTNDLKEGRVRFGAPLTP